MGPLRCENAALWRRAMLLPRGDAVASAALLSAMATAQRWRRALELLRPDVISFEAALRSCRAEWKASGKKRKRDLREKT